MGAARFRAFVYWRFDDYGTSNPPPTLDRNDLFAIFSWLFISIIIDKPVELTNKYSELSPLNDAGEKLRARLCISDHDDFYALIWLVESLSITRGRISAG
jgi:hypothetical protein